MRTNIFILLAGCLGTLLLGSLPGNGQSLVTQGSRYTYTVTPIPSGANYHYTWSVPGVSTTKPFGASDTIVWSVPPGVYNIAVFPTNPVTGCAGNNQTLTVSVFGMNLSWQNTSLTTCPKTDNQTGNFSLIANYSGIPGSWSFTYSIDGKTDQSVTVSADSTYVLQIPGMVNPSSSDPLTATLRITSVTSPDNVTITYTGSEPDAATRLCTVTIEPTPATSGIIQQ